MLSSCEFTGRKGVLNTASGLVVGYLGGIEAEEADEEEQTPLQPFEFNEASIDEMLLPVRANSGFVGVDILLTSVWPAQVGILVSIESA